MGYLYAQLDENHICTGVSSLSGSVPRESISKINQYDLETGEVLSSTVNTVIMVRVPVFTEQYIGKKYLNQGKWGTEADEILPYDETLEYGYIPPVEVIVDET